MFKRFNDFMFLKGYSTLCKAWLIAVVIFALYVDIVYSFDSAPIGNAPLTAGSVAFSDGAKLIDDNSNFFWDGSNNRLGIGTNSPEDVLHIAKDNAPCLVYIERIDSVVAVNSAIGEVAIKAGETTQDKVGRLVVASDETWDATSSGTRMEFSVTPNGALTAVRALILDNEGRLGVMNDPAEISGAFHVQNAGFSIFERTSASTNTVKYSAIFKSATTSNMVDGFGTGALFQVRDDTSGNQFLGRIAAIRDGADNEGALIFKAGTDGDEEFVKIDNDGVMASTFTANTPSSTTLITAAGGITPTKTLMRVAGDGGAIDITADPQIAAGTVDGQKLVLYGTHETNKVKIENGNGVRLDGGVFFDIGDLDNLTLRWNEPSSVWCEESRADLAP